MARSSLRRRHPRAVLAAACALALPSLLACNAILGLDEFARTECGIDPCPPPDGGPDTGGDVVRPDGGPDASPDAPRGAAAVSWPAFEMPNYRDGAVADPPPRPLSYSTAVADEVEDLVTDRVWRKTPAQSSANITFEAALKACADIPPKGAWRLPKRIELVTLLDYGRATPFIDTSVFDVSNVRAWTSSEVRPFDPAVPFYWTVDFEDGKVGPLAARNSAVALCVKGQ